MYISDDDEPKYTGEVEIPDTLGVAQDTRTSEDLYNQISQKSEDMKNYWD